jgi:hypothetical protein
MALSRLARRSDAFDPARELKISRMVNVSAEALIAPEWLLTTSGPFISVGSTLAVAGRRPPS